MWIAFALVAAVSEDVDCTVGSGFVGESALFGVALLDCVDLGVNVIE